MGLLRAESGPLRRRANLWTQVKVGASEGWFAASEGQVGPFEGHVGASDARVGTSEGQVGASEDQFWDCRPSCSL